MMNEPGQTPTPPATADVRAASASGYAQKLSERLAAAETFATFKSVGTQIGLRPEEADRAFVLSEITPSHEIKGDKRVMKAAIEHLKIKHYELFDSESDVIPDDSPIWRDAAYQAANPEKIRAHARAKLKRLGLG
jgi:hypothetical protein